MARQVLRLAAIISSAAANAASALSVVVSSVLLLSSSGVGGCAATVGDGDAATGDAPQADAVTTRDAAPVLTDALVPPTMATDATRPDVAVADALADARSMEAGWPTTKAFYCTTPEDGPAFCCNHVGSPPTHCCIANVEARECITPCTANTEGTRCVANPSGG